MTETRWRIPLSDVIVDDELVESVLEAVRSGWWSMGPRVEEFEREFAAFCGARHAIAVANGTAALHLALLAVGCGPGDEVVVPSLNFVAAANTIMHTGAEPVFCDIVGPDGTQPRPRRRRGGGHTAHEGAGRPALRRLSVRHGGDRRDRGAARPRRGRGRRPRARGEPETGACAARSASVGCFSFFSNKNLPVGEGGMMVTDDDELADAAAAPALARHDDAHVGPPPRACVDLRRRPAGLQLPPGRGSRGDRARPARRDCPRRTPAGRGSRRATAPALDGAEA